MWLWLASHVEDPCEDARQHFWGQNFDVISKQYDWWHTKKYRPVVAINVKTHLSQHWQLTELLVVFVNKILQCWQKDLLNIKIQPWFHKLSKSLNQQIHTKRKVAVAMQKSESKSEKVKVRSKFKCCCHAKSESECEKVKVRSNFQAIALQKVKVNVRKWKWESDTHKRLASSLSLSYFHFHFLNFTFSL